MTTTSRDHDTRVSSVAAAIAGSGGSGAHVDKGGVHHVVPLPGDRRFGGIRIDTSALTRVLAVDPVGRTCVAEPGATFEAVVAATLPHGLVPTVVPELRGITLGGAVAGCSVESMSWRYGGFHDSCRSYEVVSARGEVLELSSESEPELFEAVHGSYGTLGVLTRIEFDLVPAAPYVAMTYRRLASLAELEVAMAEVCSLEDADDPDRPQLVDAIAFAPDLLVLCLGRFVDHPGRPPSDYSAADIYHRSARRLGSDVLRTEDYFFRYDPDCHWLTATVPPLQWRWVRRALGRWFLGSKNLISWSNRLAPLLRRLKRRPDVVCDVFIPASRLGDFWGWYRETFDFWPLWIVPYRPPALYPWVGPSVRERWSDELFIDCAIYGAPNVDPGRDLSELLEHEVFDLGGIKTLIGRNHYAESRFWEVYDREAYQSAKKRLDPDGLFPDVYEKLGRVG